MGAHDFEAEIKAPDNVNHPSHYADSCSIECIDTMEIAFGPKHMYYFCLMNAYKYLWRHNHKNGLEDIKKAAWYANKAHYYYNLIYLRSRETDKLAAIEKLVESALKEYEGYNESGE